MNHLEPPPEPQAVVVDARGLRCPLPVIQLARACADLPAGREVVVLTTDPAAGYDIPAWARMRGHQVVQSLPADYGLRTTVRLGRPAPQ